MTEIQMSDLFEQTSEDLFRAAAEEGLVHTGSYVTKVSSISVKRNDDDADYNPGRSMAYLNLSFYEDDGRTVVGQGLATVSWEPKHYETARGRFLDNASKLYSHLVKAVDSDDKSVGGILTAAQKQAFMSKVFEQYTIKNEDLFEDHLDKARDDGKDVWIALAPDADDAREHYLSLGYEPRVSVQRFWKIK